MFSFFRKKKQPQEARRKPTDLHEELRNAVNDLRAELGDEAFVRGMELQDRINGLRSVQLSFFQSLLALTDDVSDHIIDLYEPHGKFNALEVHGFCACIVTTAISVVNLPDDQKPIVMDIYLGLWVDGIVQNGNGINGPALKDQIVRLWSEYRPFIIHTETEPVQYIIYKSDSAAMRLVSNVDRLAGVTRHLTQQHIAATRFKSMISEAVRTADHLVSESIEVGR
ncbi:hypothetical protein [Rhizobium giardinii]|uniref:hypothetical protein n=1 Tax=Rhizobium giardinii TaxID=56731 RepID=UPI003D6F5DE9